MITRPLARVLALVSLFMSLAATVTAQPTASVRGRVSDPSGAAVPGAALTLNGPVAEQRAITNSRGEFEIAALPPGTYVVVAEVPGFSLEGRAVMLTAGRQVWLDLALQTAPLTETIQVVPGRVAGTTERVARLPGSVEIVDRETLEQSNVFTTNEALRKVSGVNVRDEEGLGLRPNIGIRGTNPTRSSRVLLLEDGIPLTYAPYGDNASYYHPPVDRFETIEVLKGSGQIAYGPMTVGGVINYITPLPPIRPRGAMSFAGGNRDYVSGHATYGATTGRVGYLFDVLRKQGAGARDNVSSKVHDFNGKTTIAGSEAQTFTIRGSYFFEDSNVTYSGLRDDEWRSDPRSNVFRNDFFNTDRGGAAITHQWAPVHRFAISSTVYGSAFKRHWWRQSSNSAQRPNDSADPACGGMENLNTTCGNEGRLRQYYVWGAEPRVHAVYRAFGLDAESDLGVRIHHERQERLQKNGDLPTSRDGRTVEDNLRTNTALAGFVQQRIRFGRWSLTPGLRIEHVGYERRNNLAGVSGQTWLTELIPGIGVAHGPSGRLTWFAGLHRGFAPPRTEDLINNNTGGVIDLDPELSWNFELGARSELAPGIKVDATFFRMNYENQIVPASVAGGVGATLTNAGETLHQGVETSVRLDTARLLGTPYNVYVRAAVTYLPIARFEGTRFSSISGFQNVSITGHRLPYAPEHLATIGIGYALTDSLDLMVEGVKISRQFGDDLNTVAGTPDGQRGELPGNFTWNTSANYKLPKYHATVFLTVKNIADRLYIADRSRGLLPGTPRLVQAGLKFRF